MIESVRYSFQFDGKTIEYWNESRRVRWGHATMDPPPDLDEENAHWYYGVDGAAYELRPVDGPEESGRAELEALIKLFYLRGPGVANPGEDQPRYCLKDATPLEPAGSPQGWPQPGEPYYGRPIEWTRTETGEVEIELAPPPDLEGALPVMVGSPYLVRLPPEE